MTEYEVDVFISYSHRDRKWVRKLYDDLVSNDVKAWMDTLELEVGDVFHTKIADAIQKSRYFSVVISPHSMNSFYIRHIELSTAFTLMTESKRQSYILPLLKKYPPTGIIPELKPFHYLDFTTPSTYNQNLMALVKKIKNNTSFLWPADFTPIALDPIANIPIEHLAAPFHGEVKLGGIPFRLLTGKTAAFSSISLGSPERPKEAALKNLKLAHLNALHILLQGAWVLESMRGKKVGEIELIFDTEAHYVIDLIAGVHVREAWHFEETQESGHKLISTIISHDPTELVHWQNVWEEKQTRSGQPAKAVLDMLTIKLPDQYKELTLADIVIRGLSEPVAGICVIGITAQN